MKSFDDKMVRINLSRGDISTEKIDKEILRKYPGGKALGYYIIATEVPPASSPISPENKLLFVPGALSGLSPGASKVAVVSISPETGLLHDGYAGDRFGPFLRRWGIRAVIVEGKANRPVYLIIGNKIKIESAESIWGSGVYSATDTLWNRHGDGAVAMIGPAGENTVRFANIMFDTERSAGRGGLGAVMGSKNLKAVFVQPINLKKVQIKIQNVEKWDAFRAELYEKYEKNSSPSLKVYGTTDGLVGSARRGMSPGYNFLKPYLPDAITKKLGGEEAKKYEIEPERFIHGKSCPVKCARYVEVKRRDEKIRVKPEYESLAMLGAATGIFDFEEVSYLIHLANDLGIDSIATGNIIGWLFELVEKGEITEQELGFSVFGFGDAQAEERLMHQIANRHGIGAILAEGVRRASEILNRGQNEAVHVKGLEAPAWDPRGLRTYGLSYATADVGASHLRGWPSPRSLPNDGHASELVPSMINARDMDALFDSLGLCKFIPYEMEDIENMYSMVTGENPDLKYVGWRVESIARVYDVIGGLNPCNDDIIPSRWWISEEEGPAVGNAAFQSMDDFIDAREEFYKLRGWHELGAPLPATLKKLGAEEFIDYAERALKNLKRRCEV